jgi:hypothetical protein
VLALIKPSRITQEVIVPNLIHTLESTRVSVDEIGIQTIDCKAFADANLFTDAIDHVVHQLSLKAEDNYLWVIEILKQAN